MIMALIEAERRENLGKMVYLPLNIRVLVGLILALARIRGSQGHLSIHRTLLLR